MRTEKETTRRRRKLNDELAPMAVWSAEPLADDVKEVLTRIRRADGVKRMAIMPDVHVAGESCTGAVVATERIVYPQLVGGDIGCGYAGAAIEIEAAALLRPRVAEAVFAELRERVPFMRHRSLAAAPGIGESELGELSCGRLKSLLAREGRIELGTVGRGNHFLEFQEDEYGRLWVMVHSGSRALGPAVAAAGLGAGRASKRAALVGLEVAGDAGQRYLNDAVVAERYAARSREMMLREAMEIVRSLFACSWSESSLYNTNHNHVREEVHSGVRLWVHRKGANAASAGEFNAIPGSMGAPTYHVAGRGEAAALRSSSHGAGRAMTRKEARRRIKVERLREDLGDTLADPTAIERLVEEAPSAYKPIGAVMRAQKDLVKIIRRLRPVLVYKSP